VSVAVIVWQPRVSAATNDYLTQALRNKGLGPFQWWQGTLDLDLTGNKAKQQRTFEELARWLNTMAVNRGWFRYVFMANLDGCYRHSSDLSPPDDGYPAWAGNPPVNP
jgi:hypothetical protein